jgi:DNA-binding CsgD family transcriptional regulator
MSHVHAAGPTPLIERHVELALFDQLLGAGPLDAARLVVVEGPAGIGKSRLMTELRDRGSAVPAKVLWANGSELEREFPFGVVRQLFEPLLVSAESRALLLDGAAGSAASVFDAVSSTSAGDSDGSFAALHGLYWLTVNLASEQPVLLIVDDLHWCDRPSLRFLSYLARRLEGLQSLLVVGLRTAEPGTDPVLLGEIAAHPDAVRVHPGPLSEPGVTELVRTLLGEDPEQPFVAACRAATGGNPLLLRQLLASLVADGVRPRASEVATVNEVGPRAVSRTVLTRLRRLPPEAARVAQAVAVLGSSASLPFLTALCDLDERAVVKATSELARAEILRPDASLGFIHPLVRDAVYHDLPAAERALQHAAAAVLLRDAGAPDEAVATQLLAAPHRGERWVTDLLRRAAAGARQKGAADSAVAYLGRALAEPAPPDIRTELLLELGLAETLVSGPAAATHLREAWDAIDDPAARANVAATLAGTLLFTAPAAEAIEVTERALAEIPDDVVDERQALEALRATATFFGAEATVQADRLKKIRIEGAGTGAKKLAAITALYRALTGESAEACVPLAREALADGILIDADPGLFPVTAITVLVMADLDEALAQWDRLRERAHRGGSLLGILTVGLWRGFTLLWRGELLDAEESLTGVEQDFLSWGLVQSSETYLPAFLGLIRALRGDLDGARAMLDPDKPTNRQGDGYRHLLGGWAELLLLEGRYDEALAVADDLAGQLSFSVHPGWSPWRSLKARALAGLGHVDEALEAAREDLAHARAWGAPGMLGRALGLLGRLTGGEEGLAMQREAVALLERATTKVDLATARLELGAALRRARRPTEAREPLREALELADRCGAAGIAARARAELHATGARPRTTALRGADALTASERRVADLAAEGRSNKEIAQTLYVTPKTVEVHLSNAYRKLDIRSRRDLGRALI